MARHRTHRVDRQRGRCDIVQLLLAMYAAVDLFPSSSLFSPIPTLSLGITLTAPC